MTTSGLLTLLTDFGLHDTYVGVMKGAIAQIAPTLTVIDLTHQIPPQNILAARFHLMTAYPYFPNGTVHVAVVDPGVGSIRRAIALQLTDGFLVGPDNGIFSGILAQHSVIAAVELTNPDYWRAANLSHTFHGRDIFAPVGAHLATGVSIQALGNSIDPTTLVSHSLPDWTQTDSGIQGYIQSIDHFGNLITTIPARFVQQKSWSVVIEHTVLPGKQTYAEVPSGTLLSLVGSHGWVEIAVNGGSAQARLSLSCGDPIEVIFDPAVGHC